MAVDLRQVMAAILTFSMFAMLGNMIKREHIDPFLEMVPVSRIVQYEHSETSKVVNGGSVKGSNETRRPCWRKDSMRDEKTNGYIFFSLTHGPEYHASQVANAILIAKHVGATLVLPDIREANSGDKRHFEEIYDINKFIASVGRVVQVTKNRSLESSKPKLRIIRVPERVSKNYIAATIEPIFKRSHNLRIVTYFEDSSASMGRLNSETEEEYHCLAAFESLKLNEVLQDLVESMVETLQSISLNSRGHFVAVDLRLEVLQKSNCQATEHCFNAEEISHFLKRVGAHANATIYLTQAGWHTSLDTIRNHFPQTYNKDAIMPAYEKAKFLASKSGTYEKAIDIYICSQADIFIPAFPSRFYVSVVGERIANGKEHVLVPSKNGSLSMSDSMSPYIVKKTHFAYPCFC